MIFLKALVGTILSFLVIDLIWITSFVQPLYHEQIGSLLREQPDIPAAIAFYLSYAAATVYLAVLPGLRARSARVTLLNGAVLGFITYATYSMTNYSVLEDWTVILVATDIPWGMFLTSATALGGYLMAQWGIAKETA